MVDSSLSAQAGSLPAQAVSLSAQAVSLSAQAVSLSAQAVSLSAQAGSLSAQAVPRLVWNLKVRYTVIPSQIPNPQPVESSLHRPTSCSFKIYIIITSTSSSSERDTCNKRIVGLLHTRICLPLLSSGRLFFLGVPYEVKERTLIWRSCPSVRLSAVWCQRLARFS